jgi:hypothetical protein
MRSANGFIEIHRNKNTVVICWIALAGIKVMGILWFVLRQAVAEHRFKALGG